jgi:hypothetical protein
MENAKEATQIYQENLNATVHLMITYGDIPVSFSKYLIDYVVNVRELIVYDSPLIPKQKRNQVAI